MTELGAALSFWREPGKPRARCRNWQQGGSND
jgi:hypothetical protein